MERLSQTELTEEGDLKETKGKKSLEPNDNELNIPKSTESSDRSRWGGGGGGGVIYVSKSERSQINVLMIFLKSLEKERQATC
jgi:hypothetical protein